MEVLAKNWLCFIVILLIYNTFYNVLTARAQGTNTSITDYILYKDLLNNLLVDYDPFLRPRRLIADVVDVNVSFAPINILQFDVTGQAILMSGYFTATWVDELITWKPADYNNISGVKLQLLKVWFPRLVIGNFHSGNAEIAQRDRDTVYITSEGLVTWVTDGIYSFTCPVNVVHYPFDIQQCDLVYYVSDESVSTVNLHSPATVSLTRFTENSEWRLAKAEANTVVMFGTTLVWNKFTIERRALFTVYTIVIPLICLSVLNLFAILVPISSGEKGSLTITIFLSYGFFISITRDDLPHNSVQASYFIVYVCVLLILSAVTVLYVMIQAMVFERFGHRPVRLPWQKNIVNDISVEEEVNFSQTFQKETNGKRKRPFTYKELLQKLDNAVFCVAFASLLIYSAVLWHTVASC